MVVLKARDAEAEVVRQLARGCVGCVLCCGVVCVVVGVGGGGGVGV
jgi:hypothetical protein